MYVSRDASDSGDGVMIWILAVVAALCLVGSVGWAVVFGGFNPPTDPATLYGPPQSTVVASSAVAPGKP
jgi:hypothetical protein